MTPSYQPSPEVRNPPFAGPRQAAQSAPMPVFRPDLVRSLRMHPIPAAIAAAAVFLAILFLALRQHPVYEAEALVDVEPAAAHVLDEGSTGLFDSTRYDSSLAQQMQTAQRLDVLTSVVQSLPRGTWQQPGETAQQAAIRLQAALKIQRVLTSYQLSFTLRGEDPQKTADTLNALVSAYLETGRKATETVSGQRAEILTEEKTRLQAELDADRTEQAKLSASLGMANPGFDTGNPYDAQLSGLRTELAAARESHEIAAAQLASVSGAGSTSTLGLAAASNELINGDSGLSSMRATISQRRAVLAGQMAGLTPENPIYKQDQGEIADLDRSLDTMTTQMRDQAARRLQDKLRTDLARTGDVESRINAQLAAQTYAATNAGPKLQRATELTADLQRLTRRYAAVDDSLRGIQLDNAGPGLATLALPATAPVYPVPSRKRLTLLAALPLALLVGAIVAIFLRKRDPHVYNGPDVVATLGFSPIAVLPHPDDVSAAVTAEYLLRLAGGVEGAYRQSGARTFVLTAAGPLPPDAELLIYPLEARLHLLGLTVATVTARQMMDPAYPASLGLESTPPASQPGTGEGIAPANLDLLKTRTDLILIDAPPLLQSAEAEYLVRCADATILLTTSGITLCRDLKQSGQLLENLHVRGIATVVQGLQLRVADTAFRNTIAALEAHQSAESVHSYATSSPARADQNLTNRGWGAPGHAASSRDLGLLTSNTPAPDFDDTERAQGPVSSATIATPELVTPEQTTVAAESRAEFIADPTFAQHFEEVFAQLEPQAVHAQAVLPEDPTEIPLSIRAQDVLSSEHLPAIAVKHPVSQDSTPIQTVLEQPPLAQASTETVAVVAPQDEQVIADPESLTAPEPVSIAPEPERELPAPPPMPRLHPTRDFSFAEPPRRNWFQRFLQRNDQEIVSILPDDDEDENDENVSHRAFETKEAAPLAIASPDLESIHSVSEEPEITAPEPVVTHQAQADPLAKTDDVEQIAAPQELDAVGAELKVPETAEIHAEAAVATPVAQVAESIASPEIVEEPLVEIAQVQHIEEPALVAKEIAALPEVPQAAKPVPSSAASVKPIPSFEIHRPAVVLPEPVRAARWDPTPVSRTGVFPWRDRRVAPPNTSYTAPERRFNWNTGVTIGPVPVPQPERQAPPQASLPDAGPSPTPASRPLSRKWGLLSQFDSAAPDVSAPADDPADSQSPRNYRRG